MRHFLAIAVFLLDQVLVLGQDCRLQLTGHIQDEDTRQNLSAATVYLLPMGIRQQTDRNGDFQFENLCPGTYAVEVTHVGCAPVRRLIELERSLHLDISLPHVRQNLEEVVVESPVRPDKSLSRALEQGKLEQAAGKSLADALSGITGVQVMRTGYSIARPVIQGMHGMRILTINNGVRHEGQQWGNEHAPEIDTYMADRLEWVSGAESLRYGTDALAGAVLVNPRPLKGLIGASGDIHSAYSTNNGQYTVSGTFEHKPGIIPALSYRLQGTLKQAGNMRTPDYRLNNTGFRERSFSAAAGWRGEHVRLDAFYSQFQSDIGIFSGAHQGNEKDLREAIAAPRPAAVHLGDRSYDLRRPRQRVLHRLMKVEVTAYRNNHRFQMLLSGQYNHRSEYDVLRDPDYPHPQVRLSILTLSGTLAYAHPAWRGFRGTLGGTFVHQDNGYSGRYLIPMYRAGSYAAFWIEKWSKSRWFAEAGLRVERKDIHTQGLRFGGAESDHDFRFPTQAAALLGGYLLGERLEIVAGLESSQRAPHVNELLMDGIHEGAGTYERGDIHLLPERSLRIRAGLRFKGAESPLYADLQVYRNRIDRYIYLQPIPETPVQTVVGAFPLRVFRQTDVALTGFDAQARVRLHPRIRLASRASVLMARDRKQDDWMSLMPADRWSNEVTLELPGGERFRQMQFSVELLTVFHPRSPDDPQGKLDYIPPPSGYALVQAHAAATLQWGKVPLRFGVSGTNLLNRAYRDYLNSFRYYTDEMGRNLTVRLHVPLYFGKHQPGNEHDHNH